MSRLPAPPSATERATTLAAASPADRLRVLLRAVESCPASVAITDARGAIEYVNPGFEAATGHGLAEVAGRNLLNLLSSELTPSKSQEMWDAILAGQEWSGEFLSRRRSGDLLWEWASVAPVTDDSGQVRNFVAVREDITDHKHAEQSTRLNEARLRALIDLGQCDFESEQALLEYAIDQAVRLTESELGQFHFVHDEEEATAGSDGGTGRACHAPSGEECHLESTGLWAECARLRRPVVRNDTSEAPCWRDRAAGTPVITRHLSVPVIDRDRVVLVAEVANKETGYDDADVLQLQLFMDGVWKQLTRRRTEEALERQRRLLETLVNNLPDRIYLKNAKGQFVLANRAVAQALGVEDPNDLVGKTESEILPGGAEDPEFAGEREVLQTGQPLVNREVRRGRGGQRVLLTKVPLVDSSGLVSGLVGIERDITDLRAAEEAIRHEHHRTNLLLRAIPSIVIAVGPDDRVIQWNPAAEEAFALPASQVLGKSILEVPIAWDWGHVLSRVLACRETSGPMRLDDTRYQRPDGKEGFLNLRVNPVRIGDETSAGYVIVGADVTERRVLEATLAQAQKLEAIGQLAAGVAHEINTPTQYVGDNMRFLREAFSDLSRYIAAGQEALAGGEPSAAAAVAAAIDLEYLLAEIPRALEQSLDGVERVAKIVRAMKEFSHPGTDEKTPIDLNRAIESTVTVARNEWKYVAELETCLDPNLPLVPCLPGEINQVILNLIINAAHAIQDVVGRAPEVKGRITVSTSHDERFAEIRVADSGTGIPPEIRARVFDHFFTTKEVGRGTGQGLAIAHSVVVKKHGGAITFESEVGRGTTFTVRLPLRTVASAAPDHAGPAGLEGVLLS